DRRPADSPERAVDRGGPAVDGDRNREPSGGTRPGNRRRREPVVVPGDRGAVAQATPAGAELADQPVGGRGGGSRVDENAVGADPQHGLAEEPAHDDAVAAADGELERAVAVQ